MPLPKLRVNEVDKSMNTNSLHSDVTGAESVPSLSTLIEATFTVLKNLGGSATNEEIETEVADLLALSEDVLAVPHDPGKSNRSRFQYRLAWARTYLKKHGLIENSARKVWALIPDHRELTGVNGTEIVRAVSDAYKEELKNQDGLTEDDELKGSEEEVEQSWQERLYHILTKEIDPAAFERLAQRVLRESGFSQVEVTGKSGDGGIDGIGIMKLNGFVTFRVAFQCKRYSGSVGSQAIRDFRGGMIGTADRGLLITTGTFTSKAEEEASRAGAPPIDLIDGTTLFNKLKELGLGMSTEYVEQVKINRDWFLKI